MRSLEAERKELLAGFPARLAFCPALEQIVRTGEAVGKSGKRIETASSITTTNGLITLRNLHLATGAARTLETGFRCGGSGLVFTQTHKDLGSAPARQHVAIDPYQSDPFNDGCGVLAIERAGLMGYLDFRENHSSRVLPKLLDEGQSFQLIYIDGSHNFEDVFVDLYYAAQLLSTNGVLLFDDSQSDHVGKVLGFTRKNYSHYLEELDLRPFHPNKSMTFQIASKLGKTQFTAFRRTTGEFERYCGYRLVQF